MFSGDLEKASSAGIYCLFSFKSKARGFCVAGFLPLLHSRWGVMGAALSIRGQTRSSEFFLQEYQLGASLPGFLQECFSPYILNPVLVLLFLGPMYFFWVFISLVVRIISVLNLHVPSRDMFLYLTCSCGNLCSILWRR